MTIHTYRVEGMTCAHCARSVEQEVSGLPGVETARVDLSAATLAVESAAPLADELLADAVTEAGYTLVGRT
jgi:copper chaperone